MYLLKKILLGLGLLVLIYGGSAGTQSSSLFVQAMSFIGLLIILIILYVFGKMLLRGLGCLPSLGIMFGITLFMMYALGMFNNGIGGIKDSVYRFIGRDTPQQTSQIQDNEETLASEDESEGVESQKEQPNGALFDDFKDQEDDEEESKPVQKEGLLSGVVSALTNRQIKKEEPKPFNPNDYPAIYVTPRVLSADTFEINGQYFKLFGIAAPEIGQTCANAQGRSYNCGREAALWLKDWIEGGELECHIIQQDSRGNMVGTCSYGPYDVGAALVQVGWALAYTKYTDAYLPYQEAAEKNHSGLWQGTFYKPWEWSKMKGRKANIKIIRPKKKKRGMFG